MKPKVDDVSEVPIEKKKPTTAEEKQRNGGVLDEGRMHLAFQCLLQTFPELGKE
ncbi:MAG: hypothetical protein Q8L02_01140 [Candidatus Nitrotoga sp.]|nr:hypothetical protein [Candidatus Nitrotoga sp.]